MASYTKPTRQGTYFNSSDYKQSSEPITQAEGDIRYLNKTGDTSTGVQNFPLGLTSSEISDTSSLLISSPNIYIGEPGDSIVMQGDLTTINTTNLDVKDSLITINKNGTNTTAQGSGLQVEGTLGIIKASIKLDSSLDFEITSTNNKIRVDNIGEKTTSANIKFNNNIDVNNNNLLNVNTADITAITDITNITGVNNTDVLFSSLGTGDLILSTAGTTRMTLKDDGDISLANGTDIIMVNGDILGVEYVTGPNNINMTVMSSGTSALNIGSQGSGNLTLSTNNTNRMTITAAGAISTTTAPSFPGLTSTSSTESTSISTGSINTSGGIGCVKSIYAGSRITSDSTTEATTTLNGSIQTDGGLSVVKSIYAGGRITTDDITDATNTTDGSIQTDGGLSVAKAIYAGGSIKSINATQSTSTTTGSLLSSGGISTTSQINAKYGLGLGTDDNSTSGGCITNTDNYGGGVFSAIDFGTTGLYLPRGLIPRQIKFMMARQLVAVTATTVITLTHTAVATDESSFSFLFNGLIHASDGNNSSARNMQIICIGTRANGGAFSTTAATIGSSLVSTIPGSLALGSFTYTWPTLTSTTTSFAINQNLTGTPSQALFMSGEWTIIHSNSNGGLFLTGIS